MKKVDVKGDNQHPLFHFLTNAAKGMINEKIKWNFTKFLIDREGNVIKRFSLKRNRNKLRLKLKNYYNKF